MFKIISLKRHNQAKIIKKSVVLFLIVVLRIYQLSEI